MKHDYVDRDIAAPPVALDDSVAGGSCSLESAKRRNSEGSGIIWVL
jgi:hypothetical protein